MNQANQLCKLTIVIDRFLSEVLMGNSLREVLVWTASHAVLVKMLVDLAVYFGN